MYQDSIVNLQRRMNANEVVKEMMKNQWTRGEEAIRSFIGTWFLMRKEEADTCLQPSSYFQPY